MWQMIQNDFDVQLISEDGDRRLFAERREKVWHFVKSVPGESSDPENGHFNWDIGQSHVPRYSMAVAVKQLREFNTLTRDHFSADDRVVTPSSDKVGIYSRGKNSYDIKLLETESGWPAKFVEAIEEDIHVLEECEAQIELKDGLFYLVDTTTPAGYPVASNCRDFIEAVAFERAVLGELDPQQISAFGIFCVWRDLIIEEKLPDDYCEQLVKNQFQYSAEDFEGSPFLDLAMHAQGALLERPIWGLKDDEAIEMDVDEATEILSDGMSKLNSYQLTQFYGMDQLHQAGLFLPMAMVLGLMPWEQYIVWKTQGYQPDSYEEQSFREATAFIKMIGEFADEN